MKKTVKNRLFVIKMLHWGTIFFWVLFAMSAVLMAIQYTFFDEWQASFITLISTLIFFSWMSLFLFAIINLMSTIFLRHSIRQVLFIVLWAVLSCISFGMFLLSLVHVTVSQGHYS